MGRGNYSELEESDIEEKKHSVVPLKGAHAYWLGPSPALEPGDLRGAEGRLEHICYVLDNKGPWTAREHEKLRIQKRRWEKRASGKDWWFNAYGTGVGRFRINFKNKKLKELRKAVDRWAKR